MAKKTVKKITKKVAKKKAKKVESVVSRQQDESGKRMSGEEIATMESFYSEMKASKAEMHTQEQFKKNLLLEVQLLELKIQILNSDVQKEDISIGEKQKVYNSVNDKMVNYIENLKVKYGVISQGAIKYDRLSGRIVD